MALWVTAGSTAVLVTSLLNICGGVVGLSTLQDSGTFRRMRNHPSSPTLWPEIMYIKECTRLVLLLGVRGTHGQLDRPLITNITHVFCEKALGYSMLVLPRSLPSAAPSWAIGGKPSQSSS